MAHDTLSRDEISVIVSDLVKAVKSDATRTPSIPVGRKEALVGLLNRAMVEPETFDRYLATLTNELDRTEMRVPLLLRDGLDIPEDLIAWSGFSALSDEQLADFAVSPSAVSVIRDYVLDPETDRGDWFFEALNESDLSQGDSDVRQLQKGELIRHLAKEGFSLESPASDDIVHPSMGFGSGGRSLRLAKQLSALAATLLVGVLVGQSFVDENGSFQPVTSVATATPAYGATRGGERVSRIEMKSDLTGFATVVALGPGQAPEVYPAPGADDIAVKAGEPREYGPLLPSTSRVLFVVSEQPSSETVRSFLRGRAYEPQTSDTLKTELETYLRGKGFRRLAFGQTELTKSSDGSGETP